MKQLELDNSRFILDTDTVEIISQKHDSKSLLKDASETIKLNYKCKA